MGPQAWIWQPISAKFAERGLLRLDGKLVDLYHPLHDGAEVAIITRKSPEALEICVMMWRTFGRGRQGNFRQGASHHWSRHQRWLLL